MEAAFADKRGHARLVEPGEHAPHIGSGPVPDGLDDPDLPVGVEGLHLAVQRFELVFVLRDGRGSDASEGQAAMLRPFPSSTARRLTPAISQKRRTRSAMSSTRSGSLPKRAKTREIEAELFAGNGLAPKQGEVYRICTG